MKMSSNILSKKINIYLIGNIFFIGKKPNLKVLLYAVILSFLQPISEIILEIKYFSDFNFSDVFLSIGVLLILFCLQSVIKNWDMLLRFTRKYIKLKLNIILILGIEILIGYMIFNFIGQFFIYALLGSFFWVTSGFLRIIIQATKALFYENSNELAKLIQCYSYLRISYFTLLLILLFNKIQLISHMKSILIQLENMNDYLNFSIYIAFWFCLIFVYSHFMLNLYPYFTKDPEVVKSIKIIQFISLKEKGRSFKEMMGNFNDYSESLMQDKLNRLIYSGFVEKDRKYKLAPHQKYYKKMG